MEFVWLVWLWFVIFFWRLSTFFFFFPLFFPPPSWPFFTEGVLGSKKTYLAKIARSAQNLGVGTFPDTISHFGAPWRPFWNLQALRRCRRWASALFATRLVFRSLLFLILTFLFKLSWTFMLSTIYAKWSNSNGIIKQIYGVLHIESLPQE